MLPWWKRLWHWKKSKSAVFMEALAKNSDLDIAKITEDALGYGLARFNQHAEESKTCNALNECRDYASECQITSSSMFNYAEQRRRQPVERIIEPENIACDTHDAGAVVEMSSFPSPSPESCSTVNADSSNQQHVAKVRKIESVFHGILRRDASKFRTIDAGGTELREVVIGGRSSDEAAGVGQARLHVKQQNPHLDHVAQHNGTAAGKVTNLKHSPGAAVPKAAVAALFNRRGRGRNIPSVGVNHGPIEGKFNDGLKLELNPGTSAATMPDATASLQPQLRPSALSTDSHRQVNSAAEELHILQPPPRSRSRSRNTAAASMDPSTSAAVVPPPPPRSRSSSRFSTSAGAQAPADDEFDLQFIQKRSAPVAGPPYDSTLLQSSFVAVAENQANDLPTKAVLVASSFQTYSSESSTMNAGSSHQQKSTNLPIQSVFNAILRQDEVCCSGADSRMERLKAFASQRKSVADLGTGTQANAEVSSSGADSRMERLKAFALQRKSVADLGAGTQANAETQLKISRAQIPDAGGTELRATPFVSQNDPQGRSINNSSAPATQTPIEVTGYDGLEKDSSLGSGATSLLVASSSLQPRFIPSAQFTDSERRDHAAATVPLGIPQPPPRSRSRSRNKTAASMDPFADADLAQC
jgi:hypothetical protein